MFYSNNNMSYINHWADWVKRGIEREQLFYDVRQLVEDMIKEIVPQIIAEQLKSYATNVETRLNGRAVDLSGLKSDLQRLIVYELNKET